MRAQLDDCDLDQRRRRADRLLLLLVEREASRLGNKQNPLDELFFILLTGNTTDGPSRRAYARLRAAYWPWPRLLQAPVQDIATAIAEAGLSHQRAFAIKAIAVQLAERLGSVTLAPLRRMGRAEAEQFLLTLPRVGVKSARCVLGYSLGHDTMPVDTHCLRVMRRLGLAGDSTSDAAMHDEAERLFREGQRMQAHVAMVLHGRNRCYAVHPRCDGCPVAALCSLKESA